MSAAAAVLRPLRADDVKEVERLWSLDGPPGGWTESDRARARARITRAISTDPDGCWAAAGDGRLLGVAIALARDTIWVLSLLMVDRDAQSGGLGRRLMVRALEYGTDCRGGLIAASSDPRALRLYGGNGFALHPVLEGMGTVDRSRLPAVRGVREGDSTDLEFAGRIDARIRGGARVDDVAAMLETGGRLFVARRGYAVGREGTCVMLAAEDEQAASGLLWSVLADAPPDGRWLVQWITGRQQWAVAIALEARLKLAIDGALCTRGELGPLHPFLPSGSLL
ncbi:MAG: hypothetical protein QOK31_118 [Solirubrobacteraceae bacterium]|nr:hypothetical protein [Solirubrobacteraceae bacterium]